jgi:hypothetical protein
MAHPFISYTVPVVVKTQEALHPSSPVTAAVSEPSAAGLMENLRHLVFGAVSKASAVASSAHFPPVRSVQEPRTRLVHVTQQCVSTSGATFAIWLNVVYLAPLTYLFVSFFIASYLRRSSAESTKAKSKDERAFRNVALAEKAGWDAAKGVEREVYGDGAGDAIEEPDKI